jgi:hypothetical protein
MLRPPPQPGDGQQQAAPVSRVRSRVVLGLASALGAAIYVWREENVLQPPGALTRGGAGPGGSAGQVFVLEPSPLEVLRARLREHALQSQPDAAPMFLTGMRWLYETHGALLHGEWEHDPQDPLHPLSVVITNLGPSTFIASELVLVASIFGPEQLAVELHANGTSSWRGEIARPSRCGEFRLDVNVVQFRGGPQFELFDTDSGCSEPHHADPLVYPAVEGVLEGEVLAEHGSEDSSGEKQTFRHNDPCACHLWCFRTPRCVASVLFDAFGGGGLPPSPRPPKMCRLLSSLKSREVRQVFGHSPGGTRWAKAYSYIVPPEAVANETRRWQQSVTLTSQMNYIDITVPPGVSRLMGFPRVFTEICTTAPPPRAELRPCRDTDMAGQPTAWAVLDCSDNGALLAKDSRCIHYRAVYGSHPPSRSLLWPEPVQCEYRVFDADAQQRCRAKLNATSWLWVGDSLTATWKSHIEKLKLSDDVTHTSIGNKELPHFPSLNKTGLLIYDWEVVHKMWRRRARETVERDFVADLERLDNILLPQLRFFLFPLPLYGEREPGDTYSRSRWVTEFMRPRLRDRGFRFVDLQQFLPVMANRTRVETGVSDGKWNRATVMAGREEGR